MDMNKLDFCVNQLIKNNFRYKVVKNDSGLIITDKTGNELFNLFFDYIDESEAYLSDVLLLAHENIKRQIRAKLEKILPSDTVIDLQISKQFFSDGNNLDIVFYPKASTINNVRGQYPQKVSLCLNLKTLELEPQMYGGSGGRTIDIKPPEGSYLAIKQIKIPFRRPKYEVSKVLNAVQKFGERWLQALKDNKENLMYKDLVDYDKFLNS